ncbi:NRDE family protein [Comamonadaceae bacterium M7527]|nr:NRDE family protein [Comamonadaceae bacterium M7527]
MCLIAFAIGAAPHLPLLVAANRDEAFGRPTQGLASWPLTSDITVLSGRDMVAGGTWMGAGSNGRVAFLTNIRPTLPAATPVAPTASSRGSLCTQWLGGISFERWLINNPASSFEGCNVVLGDVLTQTWHVARNKASAQHTASAGGWYTSALAPGVYALSNADLDTPWPKLLRLRQALSGVLGMSQAERHALLLAALQDDERLTPDALSSVFVRWPQQHYGTRSSTLMWQGVGPTGFNQDFYMQEWRYDQLGQVLATSEAQHLAVTPKACSW